MAAPAFGTSGTYGQTSGGNPATSIGLAVPASVAADDVIVAVIFLDGATAQTITAPTGFTEATDSPAQADNHGGRVFWKRATGADSGTYTFSWGTSQYAEGQAHRFTGAITTGDPFDVTVSAVDNGFVTTSPAVSDTTTVADTLLLHVATNWSGGTWTAPSGFTKRMQGGFDVATLSDKAQAASGATGSITATCTGTDRMTAWLGALKPTGGSVTHEATASVTETATITPSATVEKPATASVTETASITTSASVTKPVEATVTGTATITATAEVIKGVTATVTITATTTATAEVGVVASLTATAALTVDAAATKPLDTNVLATASITAMATVTKAIEAAVSAVAGITTAGTREQNAQATLTATAGITTTADNPGATVKASSSPTITAPNTSTHTVGSGYTSTPTVSSPATSTSTVT
jgi:hypothetical protein